MKSHITIPLRSQVNILASTNAFSSTPIPLKAKMIVIYIYFKLGSIRFLDYAASE